VPGVPLFSDDTIHEAEGFLQTAWYLSDIQILYTGMGNALD
jgi:hypothetical protein